MMLCTQILATQSKTKLKRVTNHFLSMIKDVLFESKRSFVNKTNLNKSTVLTVYFHFRIWTFLVFIYFNSPLVVFIFNIFIYIFFILDRWLLHGNTNCNSPHRFAALVFYFIKNILFYLFISIFIRILLMLDQSSKLSCTYLKKMKIKWTKTTFFFFRIK